MIWAIVVLVVGFAIASFTASPWNLLLLIGTPLAAALTVALRSGGSVAVDVPAAVASASRSTGDGVNEDSAGGRSGPRFRFDAITTLPTSTTPQPAAGHDRARDAYFRRHATTPGWIYVARMEHHRENLFKVGYTTRTPLERMQSLNAQTKGITGAIGQFRLVHSVQVPRSQMAEAAVFSRLAEHRVSAYREFFDAPLEVIVSVVDAVALEMAATHAPAADIEASRPLLGGGAKGVFLTTATPEQKPRLMHAVCPGCGRSQTPEVPTLVFSVSLYCAPCGVAWTLDCEESD